MKHSFYLFFLGLLLTTNSWSQDVKVLNLKPTDLSYSSLQDRIYFTVAEADDSTRNSLCVLDPYFGRVEKCYPIGGQPYVMAMSSDEAYIYIGLDSLPLVLRFNMVSRMVDQTIDMGGQNDFLGPYYAEEIEVSPTNAELIVVSRRNQGFSPRHEGVVVYDNGQMRMQETGDHTGSNSIVFGGENDVIWGFNNETSEFGVRKLRINANGIVEESVTENLLTDFEDVITYQDGKLFSDEGKVIDVQSGTPQLLGDFGMTDLNDGVFRAVAPAPDSNLVYFVTSDFAENFYLRVFDKTSLERQRDVPLPSIRGEVRRLIDWGGEGKLAYISRTNDFGNPDPIHLVVLRYCQSLIDTAPVLEPMNPGGCLGESVSLYVEPGFDNVFWSNGANTDSILVNDQNAYYYAAMDSMGCLSPISNTVTVAFDERPRTPSILSDPMVEICEDGEVILTSSLFFDYDSFLWSTGDTTQSIVVTTAGTYTVTASTANGCQTEPSEAVTVTVLPGVAPPKPNVEVDGDTVFCFGETTTLLAPDGFEDYLWSNGGTTREIQVTSSGRYTVQVINAAGCSSPISDPVEILVNPVPFKPFVSANQNVLASSSPVGNQWFFNGNMIPGATEQFYTVSESGFYAVQVTLEGCASELSDLVNIILTNTNDLERNFPVLVYPNPFKDLLSVEFPAGKAHQVVVFDLIGRVKTTVELSSGDNPAALNLSGLLPGTYMLQLRDANGQPLNNQRIVKLE